LPAETQEKYYVALDTINKLYGRSLISIEKIRSLIAHPEMRENCSAFIKSITQP